MSQKFNGSVKELKDHISGIDGKWSVESGKHVFRSTKGAVLNWWESNRTISIQGKQEGKAELENAIANKSSKIPSYDDQEAKIFIVHGHDTVARDQLELVLRRLDLEPYILMNSSGEGKTIIEALEGQIGRNYSAYFGIVLMTPDDVGFSKKDGPDNAEPRARQNVILETGMESVSGFTCLTCKKYK